MLLTIFWFGSFSLFLSTLLNYHVWVLLNGIWKVVFDFLEIRRHRAEVLMCRFVRSWWWIWCRLEWVLYQWWWVCANAAWRFELVELERMKWASKKVSVGGGGCGGKVGDGGWWRRLGLGRGGDWWQRLAWIDCWRWTLGEGKRDSGDQMRESTT